MWKVYIKPGCPWCIDAVDWLTQRGFEFETVNVLADPREYDRMKKLSGQNLTPTLETDSGLVLADFDVQQLATFLKSHQLTPS